MADRIRLFFPWAGIPTAISAKRGDPTRGAKADHSSDAPSAMTMVRNAVAHSTRKKRDQFGKHPPG